MMFFRHVFIIGKNDSTIKEYLRRIKDKREYAEVIQSWSVMAEVAEEFIFKIIQNDKTHDLEKIKKRAASLVEAQSPRTQIRNIEGAGRGGERGRVQWRAENRGKEDHFRVMFAEKPKQLKGEKCDGCGLDPHTGDCVKKANLQRRREEMGPRIQILNLQLERTTDQQKRVQLLRDYGEEIGRMAIGNGGRVKAKGGGKVNECPQQLLRRQR